MMILFLLILLSIVIAAGFLAGFIWSVRTGQFEDTCTPSMRLLLEEPPLQPSAAPGPAPGWAAPPASAGAVLRPASGRNNSAAGAATTETRVPAAPPSVNNAENEP